MTIEQIDRLVRRANPVPDSSVLEPIEINDLLSIEERSQSMDTRVEVEKIEEPGPPRRGPMIALAAALIVVVIGVLPVLTDSEGRVANLAGLTAMEKAQLFVDSLNEGDAETMMSLLTENAIVDIGPAQNPEDLPAHAEWQEAVEFTFERDGCSEDEQNDYQVYVVCDLTVENAWSRALGVEPIENWYVGMGFEDGDITYARLSTPIKRFDPEVWSPFRDWVIANHRQDYLIMYDRTRFLEYPYLDEKSIELWRQHTEEFVAEHNG
ncbi:MAG: hypothetical protein ACLFWH_14760 [Actinomycetota bacterium]